MAGEQKGKAYEALTKLVLEDLKADGKLKGRIFWDEKPESMTIIPDLTVGRSANAPDLCILVTHSESSKNSTFKSWRNLGELAECKVFLPTSPTVLSVIFDSSVYPVLKKLGDSSFDGQLIVGDLPYGQKILKWMEKHFKNLPKDKNEKVDSLREIASKSEEIQKLIRFLKNDVEKILGKSTPEPLKRIWEMEKQRKFYKLATAKETFVRRGLCKLLLFADLNIALRLYSGGRVELNEIPSYIYELGLANKAIGRASPADKDIGSLIGLFDEDSIRKLLKEMKSVSTQGFWNQLEKVKNIALLDTLMDYVLENRRSLTTQKGMMRFLETLHANPSHGLIIPKGVSAPRNVWLFDVIGALTKASANKSQDFGFSTFSKHSDAKSSKIGTMWVGDWCTCFFNQYLARRSGFKVPDSALKHAALVLSESLSLIEEKAAKSLKNKIIEKYVAKEFSATLLAHRGFDPLRGCIRLAGIKTELVKIRSCFGERAGLEGVASQTTVLKSNYTFINWQSSHDGHTNDKKKELCGRAVALRYSWDSKSKKFVPRPGVKKLVLVLDGTWKQSDLDALVRSGWDEIFYPDEMDKLASAIV